MLKPLLRVLNVEKGEEKPVLLLLAMGFFMGSFLYTYKIVAEALFLSTYSEDAVPTALFISALLGVASTGLFASLQNKIPFARLAIFNYLIIFCFLAIIRLSFAFMPETAHDILIFILFVFFQPVLSICILGFWGLFGRMFNLRQSKRIIGGIDSGQLTAAILISFAITLINQYIHNYDILLISMGGILVSGFFLVLIINHNKLEANKTGEEEQKVTTKLRKIFKDKYVVLLSSFLFLSMLSYMIIHFSFLTATDFYFSSEQQLVSFLGIFNGSIMIFSLLMQTFVNDRLIAMYGLRTALLVLPVVLFLLTIVSIIIGSAFGIIPGSPDFAWYFLFIALSKLFMDSLKDALETPSFKLFFMPLDIRIRFDIQAKVEGVVNEASRFIASIVILVLGLLTFFEIIHFSYLLIAVIFVWVYITNKLYQEYRHNVKKKLQGHENDEAYKQKKINYIRNMLSQITRSTSSEHIIFSLKLMERFEPNIIKSNLNELLTNGDKHVRKFALEKVEKNKETKSNIKLNLNGKVDEIEAILKNNIKLQQKQDRDQLKELITSEDRTNRLFAINSIKNDLNSENAYLLLDFLSDTDVEIRSIALQSVVEVPKVEFYPILLENSLKATYNEVATQSMISIGHKMFPYLESVFYKTRQDLRLMLKVLQVYGLVGGSKATELLWNKIDYPDKKVVAQVLVALGKCGFKAKNEQITRIKLSIQGDIANFVWNLAALEVIANQKNSETLRQALIEDNQHIVNHVFMLLSMIYDPHSIQLVKENIESKTSEGVAYAIELIDVFLSDDIKEQIILLLDDLGDSEKLNKFQNHYPQSDLTFFETLKHLLNRDFNQISRYAKICAYLYIGNMKLKNFNLILIANLFNNDWLIKESAAWTLYQSDPDAYLENIKRLSQNEQILLNHAVVNSDENSEKALTRFQKIELLKQIDIFDKIPGNLLAILVENIKSYELDADQTIDVSNEIHQYFYLVSHGTINLKYNSTSKKQYTTGELLMEFVKINPSDKVEIISSQKCELLKLDKDHFYDFLAEHYDLSLKIIDAFKQEGPIQEIV